MAIVASPAGPAAARAARRGEAGGLGDPTLNLAVPEPVG